MYIGDFRYFQNSFAQSPPTDQTSLLSRNTVDKMQVNPINSAAVKTEPSQTADSKAAVRGSKQASKAAVTGPTMLTPWTNKVNAPKVPMRTMIASRR